MSQIDKSDMSQIDKLAMSQIDKSAMSQIDKVRNFTGVLHVIHWQVTDVILHVPGDGQVRHVPGQAGQEPGGPGHGGQPQTEGGGQGGTGGMAK